MLYLNQVNQRNLFNICEINAEPTNPLSDLNNTSNPSNVTDSAHIFAKDDGSTSEVYVRDEAGNETKISPHNQSGEWEYYSKNVNTGKVFRVNMEALIKEVERLSGKTFIEQE